MESIYHLPKRVKFSCQCKICVELIRIWSGPVIHILTCIYIVSLPFISFCYKNNARWSIFLFYIHRFHWAIHKTFSSTLFHTMLCYTILYVFIMTPNMCLEKAMAPHSSTLAWKIPWTKESGRLQSTGSLGVGHDWVTSLSFFTFMHWRKKWQPTPVFLPGESQGQGSLVGCRLWGHTESDTTEVT